MQDALDEPASDMIWVAVTQRFGSRRQETGVELDLAPELGLRQILIQPQTFIWESDATGLAATASWWVAHRDRRATGCLRDG